MAGIHINPAHVGALHRQLGVPEGKPIGLGKLMGAKRRAKVTGSTAEEKEVVFAQNARKWNHK